MAEVEERFPEGLQRRLAGGTGWEQGESYAQMGERVLAALQELAAANSGTILVVTHGGSIREVLHAAGVRPDERPHVRNCAVHPVAVEDGAIRRID
jgi:broad specificity phosphatase PhoE